MADILQFPFRRLPYDGIDNPMYVSDVVAANEGAMAGLAAMAGLGPNDFAIIGGLAFVAGIPNTYTPGFFYLNGFFYVCSGTVTEGQYLSGQITTTLVEPFEEDGTQRPIYQLYGSLISPAPQAISSPVFNGDMNAYRISNRWLADQVVYLLTVAHNLGTAAFVNIGNVAGTVMAGDDPRAPYTMAQLDQKYAQAANVILKGTVSAAYTPVNPGDPVNKKYADATSGRRLDSGTIDLGDADPTGGTLHTISLTAVIPGAAYLILFSVGSLNSNHNIDIFNQVTWVNKLPGSFGLWFKEQQSGVQHVMVDWIVFAI